MHCNRLSSYKGKILIIVILINVTFLVVFEYFLQYGIVTVKFLDCRNINRKNNQSLYLLAKCAFQSDFSYVTSYNETNTSDVTVSFTSSPKGTDTSTVSSWKIVEKNSLWPRIHQSSTDSSERNVSTTGVIPRSTVIPPSTSTPTPRFIPRALEMPLKANYRYILNNASSCPKNGTNLNLLIVVPTSIKNAYVREAIRDTWGGKAKKLGIPVLFFIGTGTIDSVQKIVEEENYQYGDIIQQDFVDSYFNLTVKTVMTLKWIMQNCAEARYVLKSDDDIFVNVDAVLTAIDNYNETTAIYGLLAHKWTPHRNENSKWFVSKKVFPKEEYPDFVAGPAYIISGDAVPKLFETALRTPPIYLEDVYVTGIVAEAANISRIHQPGILNFRSDTLNPCVYEKVLTSHSHPAWDIRIRWKVIVSPHFKCVNNSVIHENEYQKQKPVNLN